VIFHIFRKDTRRLWPAVVLNAVTLGALSWHDRSRSDWLPGPTEGYLSLLAPLVAALLLALAVEQEPIAGDRQFWLTRPYSRGALLGAKLLFAAAFVHLPWLVSDCWILAAHSFAPAEYAGHLLGRQIVLAGALTLPAMALAALVRSFAQFVMELVAVLALLLILGGSLGSERGFYVYWEPFTTVRRDALVLVVAAACAAILAMQYLGRRIASSRALGAAAAAGSALVYTLFLPHTAMAIRVATHGAAVAPAIRLDPAATDIPKWFGGRDVSVALPIAVEGVAAGPVRLDALRSEIEAANGARYADAMVTSRQSYERMPYRAGIAGPVSGGRPRSLHLSFEPRTYAALEHSLVTIRGEAGATLFRTRESAWMGIGERRLVPGAGWCSTSITEDRFAQRIKVMCESPEERGVVRARLWSPDTGRDWKMTLMPRRPAGGPLSLDLSPLARAQYTWDIAPEPADSRDTWRVPAGLVANARIEVTPDEITGYAALRYEFRDIDLRKYRVAPPKPPVAR